LSANGLGRPLRVGIIGAGVISHAHMAAFAARPDRVVLAAVCDPQQPLAEALAREGRDAAVYTNHRSMLAEAGIEAAIIATPHFLHAPLAEDCLVAGKPVLVEKPLACTLQEMRRLRDLSAAHGVAVVAGQMRRFEPEITWLKRWIAEAPENFGELRSFDLQSWQNLEGYLYRSGAGLKHWLLDGKRAGGGVVISLAIHQLDLVRYLFDVDFEAVTASGRFDPPFHNGAESAASVLLRMSNGATGLLHANYLAPRVPFCEAFTAYGANGTIIQHVDKRGEYRGGFAYASSGGLPTTEWEQQWLGFAPVPALAFDGQDTNSFVNQLVAFADAVQAGAAPRNSLDENFNTIACIEAIHESLRSGATVAVQKN